MSCRSQLFDICVIHDSNTVVWLSGTRRAQLLCMLLMLAVLSQVLCDMLAHFARTNLQVSAIAQRCNVNAPNLIVLSYLCCSISAPRWNEI